MGLLNNPRLAVATESIQFQPSGFFDALVVLFSKMNKLKDQELPDSEFCLDVTRTIKEFTGLTISFNVHNSGPAIMLPQISRNHPLLVDFFRDYSTSGDALKLLASAKDGVLKGTVDLEHCRVDGVFSQFSGMMYYPPEMILSKKYSAQEHAAICLHEIGHMFTWCEMLGRTVTTNYVLSQLSRALDHSENSGKTETALLSVKAALKLKSLETKSLAKTYDKKVVQAVVISSIVQDMRSELGSYGYDKVGAEFLADEFASRHGGARYLVTALDKLHREQFINNISFRSTFGYVFVEMLKLAAFFTGVGTGIAMMLIAMDSDPVIYDTPEARFRRLRNQIVQQMKVRNLSRSDYEELQMDLTAVDVALSRVHDRRQWFGMFFDLILPKMRREWNQQQLQKELEALAMNDLFVKAQELRRLA